MLAEQIPFIISSSEYYVVLFFPSKSGESSLMASENKKSAFSRTATFMIGIFAVGAILVMPGRAHAGTPEKAPASAEKTEKSCSGDKGCGADKKEAKVADPAKDAKEKKCTAEMKCSAEKKCSADKKAAEDDEEEGEDDSESSGERNRRSLLVIARLLAKRVGKPGHSR